MKQSTKNLALLAATVAFATMPSLAVAAISGGQTLGEIAGNTDSSMAGVKTAAVGFSYTMAFVCAIAAIFKFWAHSKDDRSTPLKTPFVMLIAACLFVSLPFILSSGTKTLFKQDTIEAPNANYN